LISNGLATMGFALPSAIAAELVCPECKVLATVGDGAFLMTAQELETAVRERIPFVVLIWVADGYGLIRWKQELELGRPAHVQALEEDAIQALEKLGAEVMEDPRTRQENSLGNGPPRLEEGLRLRGADVQQSGQVRGREDPSRSTRSESCCPMGPALPSSNRADVSLMTVTSPATSTCSRSG
jgi:hypothetical protein